VSGEFSDPAAQGEYRTPSSRKTSRTLYLESLLTELLAFWKAGDGAACRALASELEGLSSRIRDLRAEIATLSLAELRKDFLPTATDQLEAVVEMTERATHRIMDAADSIEAAADGVDDCSKKKLRAATTTIYEACNFQDITGQRVRKVVGVLGEIETKINDLLSIFDESWASVQSRRTHRGEGVDGRPAEHGGLLEGPQLAGGGNSQDDIDALFADDGAVDASESPAGLTPV
jgi:chemotaxis protein CheZ